MGGRGASSSGSTSRESFIRDIVKNYDDFTRGDLQGAVEAYVMKKGMTPKEINEASDKLLKEIDNRVNKGGAVLSNKNDVINFVKKQVNVDLSKAIDENRFSSRSRTYLDIDSSKLSINEFNEVRRLLQYQKGLRFESNGAKNYAIYYQKKKK